MNKIIGVLLIMACGTAFSAEPEYFQSLQGKLDYCDTVNPTKDNLGAPFKCMRDSWESYRNQTSLRVMQSGSSNIIFVLNQMIVIADDSSNGRYKSSSEFMPQFKYLQSAYSNELKTMRRNLENQEIEISEQEARRKTNFFIGNIARYLGRETASSKPNSTTYIINGRFINCNSFGAVVTCN